MKHLKGSEKLAEDPLYEYRHLPFDQLNYTRSDNKFSYKKQSFKKVEHSKEEAKMLRRMSDEFQIVSNLELLAETIDIEANPLIKVANDW